MSLSKQFAAILEDQRHVLTLRQELCEVRKKQYQNWAAKARRAGSEETAALIEKTTVSYFEQEELALKFLLQALDEAQAYGSGLIAQWEVEKRQVANG